jgi:hypothetical protein
MQAQSRQSKPLAISVQLYRAMLNVYPSGFRREYGPHMLQTFRDSCLRAGSGGLPDLWGRTLLDYFLSVIEQYANRGAMMTKTTWIKLSGWLLAVSGLLYAFGMAASSRPEYNQYNFASLPIDRYLNGAVTPLFIAGFICTGIGILGLWIYFGRQIGLLGHAGLVIGLLGVLAGSVGVAGLSVVDSSPWWEMFMFGATSMFFGLGLFGIDCLRRKLFTRWNFIPLLTGIPFPLAVLFSAGIPLIKNTTLEIPVPIFVLLFGITFGGLALTGYRLQADSARPQSALG